MSITKRTVERLAYDMKQAKAKGRPAPIFFLGAGASKSGKIPLAGGIVEKILKDYEDNPDIRNLPESERSYTKLMDIIGAEERHALLEGFIKDAKINVTHIYLAQLMDKGYADFVLTVNFDDLMLRALALYNTHPPIYDMAVLQDLTTTSFPRRSVVYLHGQYHGLWLLNTKAEMDRVKNTAPVIFHKLTNGRPWVVLGYSGSDPIFDYICGLGRFDNDLYWVGYKDHLPNDKVRKDLLDDPNKNAYLIEDFDSDTFMLELTRELGLGQPLIFEKPFTCLKKQLENVVDIDDTEQFKAIKERLGISKGQVKRAIAQFEEDNPEPAKTERKLLKQEKIKRELIAILMEEKYDEAVINDVSERAKDIKDKEIDDMISAIYNNWGTDLGNLAQTKSSTEAEEFYLQAFEKFQMATEISQDNEKVFNNWGIYLGNLAQTKSDEEAEELYGQAFEKYRKAIEIKPDFYEAYNNWGTVLGKRADTKSGAEAEELCSQACEKYQKATEMNPNYHEAYNNWGTALGKLADMKTGADADELSRQAFEKYRKAIEIKPDFYEVYNNWGTALGKRADTKSGAEAEELYSQACEKYQKATEMNPNYHEAFYNWGTALGKLAEMKTGAEADELYRKTFEKFERATDIEEDFHEAIYNWGVDLGNLARTKSGAEGDDLYRQAFEKYRKVSEIKPDNHKAFTNWGNLLGDLAKAKSGIEAEELYRQAFEKYRRATEIKPDRVEAFNNWTAILASYAHMLDKNKSRKAFLEALKLGKKTVELGGSSYNLSCVYALLGEKENALENLEKALEDGSISTAHVVEDEDWAQYKEDEDFKELIAKYS